MAALALLVLPTAVAQGSVRPSMPLATPPVVPGAISVGSLSSADPLSPQFWGLDLEAAHTLNSTDAARIKATPATYLRYPGGDDAEGLNYTSGIITGESGSATPANTNVSAFVRFAVANGFHSMLELPAEINSSSTAAADVNYVEHTLGYTPDYWEIGYEPSSWTHFNTPWSAWGTTSGNTTPIGFAQLVQRYIFAIRAVDPVTPIVALGGGAAPHDSVAWVQSLALIDGPQLAGITVHVYPAGPGPVTGATTAGFFSTLEGTHSLSNVLANDSSAIASGCPTCSNLKLFVNEINAATGSGSFAPIMGSFDGTLYLAAEATEGLNEAVWNLDWFCFAANYRGAWELPSGIPQSQYYFFANVTSQLQNETLPSSASGLTGLYAVATTNGTRDALLAVNVNTTTAVSLNLTGAGFNASAPLSEVYWDNTTAQPQSRVLTPGTSPTLAPLSLALLVGNHSVRAPPAGPFPVVFAAKGLPPGTLWTVSLNNTSVSSHAPSIVFTEKNGSYRFQAESLAIYVAHPATGAFRVTGRGVNENISFTAQPRYAVTFTETGLPAGANWTVFLGGVPVNSTAATLVFLERNGSFIYITGTIVGYTTSLSQGNVSVNGGPRNVTIPFSKLSSPSRGTPSIWSSDLLRIVLVLVAVLVVLTITRLWLGRRPRGKGPPSGGSGPARPSPGQTPRAASGGAPPSTGIRRLPTPGGRVLPPPGARARTTPRGSPPRPPSGRAQPTPSGRASPSPRPQPSRPPSGRVSSPVGRRMPASGRGPPTSPARNRKPVAIPDDQKRTRA